MASYWFCEFGLGGCPLWRLEVLEAKCELHVFGIWPLAGVGI